MVNTDKIVKLTMAAQQKILRTSKGDGKFVRIINQGQGCAGKKFKFILDEQKQEDDVTIADDNVTWLVISKGLVPFLQGATIDYQSGELSGSRFVISNNPNAVATCNCGLSFSFGGQSSTPVINTGKTCRDN